MQYLYYTKGYKLKKKPATYRIRIDTLTILDKYCEEKMLIKSAFVDQSIAEKLNRELSPMLPENRIPKYPKGYIDKTGHVTG